MVLARVRRTAFSRVPGALQVRQIASPLSVSEARANIAAREDGPAGVHAFSFLAGGALTYKSTVPVSHVLTLCATSR